MVSFLPLLSKVTTAGKAEAPINYLLGLQILRLIN